MHSLIPDYSHGYYTNNNHVFIVANLYDISLRLFLADNNYISNKSKE